MIFDHILIHYTDGTTREVPCDEITGEDGFLMMKKGGIVTALAGANNVKLAELIYDGELVGSARHGD